MRILVVEDEKGWRRICRSCCAPVAGYRGREQRRQAPQECLLPGGHRVRSDGSCLCGLPYRYRHVVPHRPGAQVLHLFHPHPRWQQSGAVSGVLMLVSIILRHGFSHHSRLISSLLPPLRPSCSQSSPASALRICSCSTLRRSAASPRRWLFASLCGRCRLADANPQ